MMGAVADTLRLGLQLGYWTAQPRSARELVEAATAAEDLGFDSVWTGESWSSDAFSPLAALRHFGHQTELVPCATIRDVFATVERGGMEVASIQITFKTAKLHGQLYRSPDGKIQQLFFRKP